MTLTGTIVMPCAFRGSGRLFVIVRGEVDPSARVIWLLEKAGWVNDLRWPAPPRLQARQRVNHFAGFREVRRSGRRRA